MFAFEHKTDPLLPWPQFRRRMLLCLSLGAGLIAASLIVGMAGYHFLERLDWLDAFLNAAMILSGMGPLAPVHSTAGKLFAGLYALYSGFAVLIITGIAFGPVVHRMLHRLHADERDLETDPDPRQSHRHAGKSKSQ